jgi:hypothetical protein
VTQGASDDPKMTKQINYFLSHDNVLNYCLSEFTPQELESQLEVVSYFINSNRELALSRFPGLMAEDALVYDLKMALSDELGEAMRLDEANGELICVLINVTQLSIISVLSDGIELKELPSTLSAVPCFMILPTEMAEAEKSGSSRLVFYHYAQSNGSQLPGVFSIPNSFTCSETKLLVEQTLGNSEIRIQLSKLSNIIGI